MSNTEILELCKSQFEFHTEFIDKCIAELNKNTDNKIVSDIEQFCNALKGMLTDNAANKFVGSTVSLIWAYRNRLRLD